MSDRPTDDDRHRAHWQDTGPRETPSRMDIAHLDDLAAPFALGAVEPDEADWVEQHCRSCPPCSRLVADARWTVGMLPYLSPAVAPPPAAKAALFARIEQSAANPGPALVPPMSTIPASRPLGDRRPANRRSPWRFRLPARMPLLPQPRQPAFRPGVAMPMLTAAVPLVLILALVSAWGIQQQNTVADRDRQIKTLSERQTSLDQLTRNGGSVTTLSLNAGPAAPHSAIGKIFFDPETLKGMLIVEGLNDAGPNATYEVWLSRTGSAVRVADLQVDKNGSGMASLSLDRPLSQYRSIHVTPKPLAVGGGTLPTDTDDALQMYMPASPDPLDQLATAGWPDIGSGAEGGPSEFTSAATPAP